MDPQLTSQNLFPQNTANRKHDIQDINNQIPSCSAEFMIISRTFLVILHADIARCTKKFQILPNGPSRLSMDFQRTIRIQGFILCT